MRKNSVFSAFFARRSVKSVRKTVFFHVFSDTLSKFAEKAFFFCATLCKKCECSFTFFKTLCTKFAEKEKNQRFLCFFCNFRENSVLSRFSRHFVQSSQKMSKISVFWAFSATFPKKCEETVFFHVFRDTLKKSLKKCE